MRGSTLCKVAVILLIGATSGAAQQRLTLQFRESGVTLDAQNVPIQQILAEWARVGGTRIINGEKVAGGIVTLQLVDVSERQALDIVLRGVSGYMLGMRQPGAPGTSAVDRILILPTSAAPQNPSPNASTNARASIVNRPVPSAPAPVPFDAPSEAADDQLSEQFDPSVAEPSQVMGPGMPTPIGSPSPVAADIETAPASRPTAPVIPLTRPFGPPPPRPGSVPAQPPGPSTPRPPAIGNPFGVPRGSDRPGVITPPAAEQPTPTVPSPTSPPPDPEA
jgi:hypothetical protein